MEPELYITSRIRQEGEGPTLSRCRPRKMPQCHQHNDVEINYIVHGGMTYLHGGHVMSAKAGDLLIFWAGRPHQMVRVGNNTWYYGLEIPLVWVIQWELPPRFMKAILDGNMLRMKPDVSSTHMEYLWKHWTDDLTEDTARLQRAMLIEVESMLFRLGQLMENSNPQPYRSMSFVHSEGGFDKVAAMARFISNNYQESLTATDIANAAGISPSYAVTLFKEHTGSTLTEFLIQQRLSHAQLLLTTSDDSVLEIALASGFGSVSRFYAVFKSGLGISPKEFRRRMQQARFAETVT